MKGIFISTELEQAKATQRMKVEAAKLERQTGLLEYVAMMADVELPEDEEQEVEENE